VVAEGATRDEAIANTEKNASAIAESLKGVPGKKETQLRARKTRKTSKAQPATAAAETQMLALPQNAPYSLQELKEIEAERTPRSRAADEARRNQKIIEPSNPRVRQWIKHPGSMDVLGVDTPPGVTEKDVLKRNLASRVARVSTKKAGRSTGSESTKSPIMKHSDKPANPSQRPTLGATRVGPMIQIRNSGLSRTSKHGRIKNSK
jgi:hypothetical protein